MIYVYVIESERDGRYYVGQTSDVFARGEYHNHNRSKFIKIKVRGI